MSDNQSLAPMFHERSRLSMMTVLAGNPRGVAFTELRELCKLTDGNLSRHLHKLAEAGLVTLDKRFLKGTPNTTIRVTQEGIEQFSRYVDELQEVVAAAHRAVRSGAPEKTETVASKQSRRTSAEKPMQELSECQ